jgi:methylmalonyl-CoA/ethylmalonyl-CoA epimerase
MVDAPVRVAHVGIAVASIAAALPFYRDILGLVPGSPETADGATIVSLTLGEVQVELLEPHQADSPVAKFLARRGPGIHHVCYRVPDLDRALEDCRAAGYRLLDPTPRSGAAGRRVAFLHPEATAGILLELTE